MCRSITNGHLCDNRNRLREFLLRVPTLRFGMEIIMLSKVLSKNTCAECRFCCSFRRCSLWETPLFAIETVDKFDRSDISGEFSGCEKNINFHRAEKDGVQYGQMDLMYKYCTDDESEEAACEFLDASRGCVLSDEDKPFDCKIWPLRIMDKDGKLVIALTPTCPAINKVDLKEIEEFVKSGLGDTIYEYAKEHPYIIKKYRENFPVLQEFRQ